MKAAYVRKVNVAVDEHFHRLFEEVSREAAEIGYTLTKREVLLEGGREYLKLYRRRLKKAKAGEYHAKKRKE